jgi:hypothetical protein
MKYCDNCGKEISESATYCNYCGSPTHKILDTSSLPMLPHYEGIFGGRIGRMRFMGGLGFSLFPLFIVSVLWTMATTTPGLVGQILYAILLVLFVPSIAFSVAMIMGLTMRRLHDLDQSGAFAPIIFCRISASLRS